MATGLCPAAPCCCTMLCAYAHAHTDDTPVHLERALWLLRMSWTPGPCTAVCFVPDSLSPECCDPATARASTPHEPQFLTQPHLVGTPETDARAPAAKIPTERPRLNRSRAHENALGVDPAPLELSRGPHPPREELLTLAVGQGKLLHPQPPDRTYSDGGLVPTPSTGRGTDRLTADWAQAYTTYLRRDLRRGSAW